jgi:Tol biopolymer transport system component
MRPNRFINLFFLLLLSACSTNPPPVLKPTLTPGSPINPPPAVANTQSPAATSPAALTTPTITSTATAMPIPAMLNLTKGLTGNPLSPSWSPDGKYIVFSLDDPGQPNHNQLYKAAVDGSGSTRLVDHPDTSDFMPQWSPDGSQILFCSTAADGSGTNVFVVKPDGAALTQLTHDHASQCQAAWSPDSSQIALISDRQDKQSGRLYVMNADGTDLHLAADLNNSINPVWSPDGKTLIFSGQIGRAHV